MRNTFFAAALLCMAASTLIAQTQDATQSNPRQWRFGMQTGGGLASMYPTGTQYSSYVGPRSAFSLCAYAERDLRGRFGIAYEAGVAIRGAVLGFGEDGTPTYVQDVVSISYMQGAIMPYFDLGEHKKIAIGAEYGLKMNENSRLILDGQKHDLGLVAQMMYVLNTNLTFGLRANASLTPFHDLNLTDENGNTTGASKLSNMGCLLIARFRLR